MYVLLFLILFLAKECVREKLMGMGVGVGLGLEQRVDLKSIAFTYNINTPDMTTWEYHTTWQCPLIDPAFVQSTDSSGH